jgi:hypothetical protein
LTISRKTIRYSKPADAACLLKETISAFVGVFHQQTEMPNRHAIAEWFKLSLIVWHEFDRYDSLSYGFRLNARQAGFVGEKHQQRRE